MEVLKTLLIACVSAIVGGIVSFVLAKSQAKSETNKLKLANEHENELIRKESELENTAKYNAAGNIMTGLFNGMLGGAFNSPEIQGEITKKILEGVKSTPDNSGGK